MLNRTITKNKQKSYLGIYFSIGNMPPAEAEGKSFELRPLRKHALYRLHKNLIAVPTSLNHAAAMFDIAVSVPSARSSVLVSTNIVPSMFFPRPSTSPQRRLTVLSTVAHSTN